MRRHLLYILSLSSLIFIIGCSKPTIKSYPNLANKGILPLSTANPYVSGNLFIAREAEMSPYLHNFLKIRGGPAAVEIIEPTLGSPRVLMFYPQQRETYAADIVEQNNTRQWVISGPYAIERRDYRELAGMETSLVGEPVFVIHGKQTRFKFETPQPQVNKVLQPVLPLPPPATPTPKPRPRVKSGDETVVISKKGTAPTEFRPLNSDQQAIQLSLGFAERAENGDVMHTVVSTENLAAIAQWYTGSADNATVVAEANGAKITDALTPGARIRVPFRLVRNPKLFKP